MNFKKIKWTKEQENNGEISTIAKVGDVEIVEIFCDVEWAEQSGEEEWLVGYCRKSLQQIALRNYFNTVFFDFFNAKKTFKIKEDAKRAIEKEYEKAVKSFIGLITG